MVLPPSMMHGTLAWRMLTDIFSRATPVATQLVKYVAYISRFKTRTFLSNTICIFVQMDATIDYLSSHNVRMLKEGELRESSNSTVGASVGMLWLDVEGTQVWMKFTVWVCRMWSMTLQLLFSTGRVQLPPTSTSCLPWFSAEKSAV
jgi:hypothetical protein